MSSSLANIPPRRDLVRAGLEKLPAMIARAGENAAWRFIEFFTANIRNRNTRAAYAQAATQFFKWCEARGIRELRNRGRPRASAIGCCMRRPRSGVHRFGDAANPCGLRR